MQCHLEEVGLVVALPVSIDALSQQSVEFLQGLDLSTIRLVHGLAQQLLGQQNPAQH